MKIAHALLVAAVKSQANDSQQLQAANESKQLLDDKWYGKEGDNKVFNARSKQAVPEEDERRYNDLKDMAIKYWRKNGGTGKNAGFDDRKYWAYGCHCFLLGDRPMTEQGKGRPVDALDVKCKAYKDCQKCVRQDFGEQCIGEFVRYTWRWNTKQGRLEPKEKAGTCERQLFECDVQLVKDTFSNREVFNEDYHAFWSKIGFDNRENDSCPSGGNMPIEHECCGGNGKYEFWMNKNTHKCINDVPVPKK